MKNKTLAVQIAILLGKFPIHMWQCLCIAIPLGNYSCLSLLIIMHYFTLSIPNFIAIFAFLILLSAAAILLLDNQKSCGKMLESKLITLRSGGARRVLAMFGWVRFSAPV